MNISSPNRDEFYPPPELKNVVAATESLRTELTLNWTGEKTTSSYRRIMNNLETMRESLLQHYKEYYTMERALIEASSDRLTEKQRAILRWLGEKYDEEMVYTALIERLSFELEVPKSTVRWNLRGLREAGVIRAGDKDNKGIPVGLSEMGRVLADHLCV